MKKYLSTVLVAMLIALIPMVSAEPLASAFFSIRNGSAVSSNNDTIASGLYLMQHGYSLSVENRNGTNGTVLGNLEYTLQADNISSVNYAEYANWNNSYAKWVFPSNYSLAQGDWLITDARTDPEEQNMPMSISRKMNRSIFNNDGYQLAEFNFTFDDLNFKPWGGIISAKEHPSVNASFVIDTFSTDAPLNPVRPFPRKNEHEIDFLFDTSKLQDKKSYNISVVVKVDLKTNNSTSIRYKPSYTIWIGFNSSSAPEQIGNTATIPNEILPEHVHYASASTNVSTRWLIGRSSLHSAELREIVRPVEIPVSASRDIENQNLIAGGSTNVTVTIINNASQALSLMETIPSGWTLTRVSDDASAFKPSTNEWVWFNVGAGVTKTVIYRLNVPSNAAPGTYNINGNITNASGIIASVSGENSITVVDTTPPVINIVTLNTTTSNTGQAILVTVNATDNVGVTSVEANSAPLTVQSGNTFIWSGTITAIEGTHSVNVSARDAAGNVAWDNSTSYTATTPPAPGAPSITSSAPISPVSDIVGATRTFSITANQTVNVSWLINGTEVFNETGVTTSSYSNSSAATGTWNVTAVASNVNGSDSQTWTWIVQPIIVGAPNITSFAPPSPVNDTAPATRTFNITVNQTVNVTWYFDGAVHKQDNLTIASNDTITADAVTHNVTAVAQNANGSDNQTWIWNVTTVPPPVGAPNITSFAPASPVNDVAGANRTFSVTINQTANVTWYINGTEVFNQTDVIQSTYTNSSAILGTWNVTAIVQNANGTDIQKWDWIVTAPPIVGAPAIISWGNNKTNDASLNIMANVSESIRFNVTANQSIDTWNWFVNGVNQNNNFDNLSYHFTAPGTFTIKVNANNANGTSNTVTWDINVQAPPTAGSPAITNFAPLSPVSDIVGATRTFSITANQTVNVSWLINGTEVFNETGVTTSSYSNSSAATGTWNVTAVAQNTNGTAMQIWIWIVISRPTNGSISGMKFNDSDGNGVKDANEPGLANWIITLKNSSTGAAIFNTTTASDGSYKFSNLSAGSYTVGEVLKPNWTQTAPKPVPPGTYTVTITTAGENIIGKDFGNMLVPPPPPTVNGTISGNVINVATGMGIPNVTVRLVGIVGMGVDTKQIRAETMTDSEGRWMFDNLPAGRYIIIEQLPKGFIPVSPPVMNLMLAKGQNSMDNNFTNKPVESLIPKLPLSPTRPMTEEQESK